MMDAPLPICVVVGDPNRYNVRHERHSGAWLQGSELTGRSVTAYTFAFGSKMRTHEKVNKR